MRYFACEASAVCRPVSNELAACERSFRSVTHDVDCEEEEVSLRTELLLVVGGDQEMRTRLVCFSGIES